MKKFAAIFLAVAIVLSVIPFAVFAKDPITTVNGTVNFAEIEGFGINDVAVDGVIEDCYKLGATGTISASDAYSMSDKYADTFGGATWYMVNSADKVYFACEVIDSDVVTEAFNDYRGDMVELYLPGNNGNPWAFIRLTPANANADNTDGGVNYPNHFCIWRKGCKFASKLTDDGYIVEFCFPRGTTGFGDFDFGVGVADYDSNTVEGGTITDDTRKNGGFCTFGASQIRDDIHEGEETYMEYLGRGTRYTYKAHNYLTFEVTMTFPEEAPDGTTIDIACAYMDPAAFNGWSGGNHTGWVAKEGVDDCTWQVLHFVKGSAQTLNLKSYFGEAAWLTNLAHWAVVNDYDAYQGYLAAADANYVYGNNGEPKVKSAAFTGDTAVQHKFTLTADDSYFVAPAPEETTPETEAFIPTTIRMVFPEEVPNGSTVTVANAYADGVDEYSNGGFCEGTGLEDFWQLRLKFVKGEVQELTYPDLYRVGNVDWYFNKGDNWSVVNDEENYKQGALTFVSFDPETRVMTLSVSVEDCIAPVGDWTKSAYGTMNINGEIEDIYANGATYYIDSDATSLYNPDEAYVGPANAIVHIANDVKTVYIAAEVYENTIRDYGAEDWMNDAVEIWLPGYKGKEGQVKLALAYREGENANKLSLAACSGLVEEDLEELSFAAKKYEDHYVVEVAIPIENLAKNDAGNIVFSLQLDDFENEEQTVAGCFGVQAKTIETADRELILAERPIISWKVIMVFPDDVPAGTTISIANGFADGKFNPEYGSGDQAWEYCAGQVLTFVKGSVDTLMYVDCPTGDCAWLKGNWAVCNDLEGYQATAWDDAAISDYTNRLTPVDAGYVDGVLVFTLKANKRDCVTPGSTAHITVVFPDDIPDGATVSLAHAFADGKMNPEWGSGDPNWANCAGQILTFVKGSVDTLDYYGLPELKANDNEWIFGANEWAIANDAEGYKATAWDDVEIADYNIGANALTLVDLVYTVEGEHGEANVTYKVNASACVYDEPETGAPETAAPETAAPETTGFVAPEGFVAVAHVEINPAFDLYLDADGKVLAVHALNEDAESFVEEIDFEGLEVTAVVNSIIEKAVENEFLTEDNAEIKVEVAMVEGADVDLEAVVETISTAIAEKVIDLDLNFGAVINVEASEEFFVVGEPETSVPDESTDETQGEDGPSPITADIVIVAAGLALAASAVVIFKKKH